MELVSITVERYRSITKAHRIRLARSTTLVGKNNEGKSNILRALVAAMNALTRGRDHGIVLRHGPLRRQLGHGPRVAYNWDHDFPLHLKKRYPQGESVIDLEFQLTDEEVTEFKREIRSKLNGTLPIRITFGAGTYDIKVVKQGRGSKSLSAKSGKIANFIAERLEFQHIPAVRTALSSEEIVRDLVDRELATLEDNDQYKDALRQIEELQKPILTQLSASIRETLVKFLPAVRSVEVEIRSDDRSRALRRVCEIAVDDGTRTLLEYKGDGVQSLAALGMMRHASDRFAGHKSLVIAIEEPESHLHPSAIHDLRDVLQELSAKHQVVITTHCPLFVNRSDLKSNIVVQKQQARPAATVEEIRRILGVRASDNLRHAEIVLVVEGDEDRDVLKVVLSSRSSPLAEAIRSGMLAFEPLRGASNLGYVAGLLKDSLCSVHAFLDNDKAGHDAATDAQKRGLLEHRETNFANCPGMGESELEDLYDLTLYEAAVHEQFLLALTSAKFKNSAKKWSERMRDTFLEQGKQWDDGVKARLKRLVAQVVVAKAQQAIHSAKLASIDGLVASLERRLGGDR